MPESRLQKTRAAYPEQFVLHARLPEPHTPTTTKGLSLRLVREYDIKADLHPSLWIVPAAKREQNR